MHVKEKLKHLVEIFRNSVQKQIGYSGTLHPGRVPEMDG